MPEDEQPPIYPIHGSLAEDIEGIRQKNPSTTHSNNRTSQHVDPPPPVDFVRLVVWDESWKKCNTFDEDPVVTSFFSAIEHGQDDIINTLISNGMVNVESADVLGRLPIAAAVESGHVAIVQQLMDFGADVNCWSFAADDDKYRITREQAKGIGGRQLVADINMKWTPLMIAAKNGNITLVKLLRDVYHADDSFIAKDGQTALRLAAANGHREVVDILPATRGGGFRRWKYKNRKAFRLIRKHSLQIFWIFRICIYEIPRFLVWTLPYHVIIEPIRDCSKWLYKNRNHLVSKFINTVKKISKYIWKRIKSVPKYTKQTIQFFYRAVKYITKGIYKILFVRLPNAIIFGVKWVRNALKNMFKTIAEFLSSIVSAFHTLVVRILNIVKNLTWADVGRGFIEVFHWIFIRFPQKLGHCIIDFFHFIEKFLVKTFDWLGEIINLLVKVLFRCVIYIPKRIWKILSQFGDILNRAGHEIRVYFDPKLV